MRHSRSAIRQSLAAGLFPFIPVLGLQAADGSAQVRPLPSADSPVVSLVVTVDGLAGTTGQVGCALYPEVAAGRFPLGASPIASQWMAAATQPLRCVWGQLPPGRYAVAVSHDLNGNRRTDTNLVGMPTEAWGVSQGVRPWLRAPRFDEAMIELGSQPSQEITVRLAR